MSFADQTSTTVTWTVNLAAGTQIVLYVEDADENDAWSGTVRLSQIVLFLSNHFYGGR